MDNGELTYAVLVFKRLRDPHNASVLQESISVFATSGYRPREPATSYGLSSGSRDGIPFRVWFPIAHRTL